MLSARPLASAPVAPPLPCKLSAFTLSAMLMSVLWSCTTAPEQTICAVDADCEPELSCLEGLCQPRMSVAGTQTPPMVDCLVNSDCAEAQRCVEGVCYDNECVDGEERACDTQCGTGLQLCSGGIWRACSAQPTNELCGTGEDEDCDGQVDENCGGCSDGERRACETSCGAGEELCLNGNWVGCTAPRPRLEVCGEEGSPVDEDCDGEVDEGCNDTSCTNGEERSCDQGCGAGREVCRDQKWGNCDARAPQNELCDGQDNDCDGDVDEEIMRDCSTSCGPGSERCEAGSWVGCNAPEMCACVDLMSDQQACGQCGLRQRSCDTGSWGAWEMCVESGQCEPGTEDRTACGVCGVKRRFCEAVCEWGEWTTCTEVGVCEPGAVEEEACSASCGGVRRRTCSEGCEWSEWSACEGGVPNACAPGAEEREPCERCGERVRTCTDQCAWSAWSECGAQGVCEPGEVGSESCGASVCAARERTCDASCSWGSWGECIDGGVCSPGETEQRTCGRCGTSTRTCESSCGWSEWSACDEPSDACTPGDTQSEVCGDTDVGVCQRGTRSRTCSNACTWQGWGSCLGLISPTTEICGSGLDENCDGTSLLRPDRYEGSNGNNSCGRCYSLASEVITINATIDSVNDAWDYYCVQVTDGSSLTPSTATISLSNIPSGADYDLFLYKGQSACAARDELASSLAGSNSSELIEWTENYFSDDSDVFIIGVRKVGARSYDCDQSYTLSIDLDI